MPDQDLTMTPTDRYEGKPMLRLLDSYVLWALGKLEPGLEKTFNAQGSWQEIISKVMDMPADMPDLIRQTWQENLEIAENESIELTPESFSQMFVDANFSD